jgi:hypothetical protein
VNSETTCAPGGARDGSSVVGITPSLKGYVAGIPARASSNERSSCAIEGAISKPPLKSFQSGSSASLGSSLTARLIFTTPERLDQCSTSWTNSGGSSARSICRRKVICGWHAVATIGAWSSSPP